MDDLFGISIIKTPELQPDFDLVAVHGIKGHPYQTWTHPNGEKWLEDYLPSDLPNTRIMTFGYDAQVFTSSKGHITDFAEQLLQHLTSVRRSTQSLDRPIIFLCHSLGGLVVKKALLLAQEIHDAADIRKHTKAIVFMGTPHRGSQLASYADIAITCIKAAGVKANVSNIQHLRLDSDTLEEIGSQFGSLLQSTEIKVLTFYELKSTKIAGVSEAVVVPPWSAKLGLGPPLETIIPVDSDHRQIAQLSNQKSKQYSVLKANLVHLTSRHRDIRQNDSTSEEARWKDILLWLAAFRTPSGCVINKERASGTCQWIFEKQLFKKWRSSEASAGLWISGRPGVGKTMLSNYISNILKAGESQDVLTLYCHSYRSLNDPVHALVRDILFQSLQIHGLADRVKSSLLHFGTQTNAMSDIAFDTLLDIMDDTLRKNSGMSLIIDGVDEIYQPGAELDSFLNRIRILPQSPTACKTLIISRKTSQLENFLAGWEALSISTSDSLYDISIFLNKRIEKITHLGDRREEVIEKLVDGSKGLFLWADLAVSELDHLRTWNEVQALLQNGNRGLDETYATIIKQLDTSSDGLFRIRARALPLAAIACRPFRLEELIELLAIEVSKTFIDPGDKLLGAWPTVSRACGPFLQMNEHSVIELIHVSAKEFLLSNSLAKSLSQNYLLDGSVETEMACLCLTYLNFMAFRRIPGEVSRLDVDKLSQQYPLLDYASNFWADHFLRSDKVTSLQLELLYRFLNSPCSVSWVTAFYIHFSLKRGESHGTILTAQHSILANLQKKLRVSEIENDVLCNLCIDKCSRLLLESIQDSLRIEQFHSGPAAESTLEKKLRLSECYSSLCEWDAAQRTASDAFDTAHTSLGRLHPLTLQLERGQLYIQARRLEISSSLDNFTVIPNFHRLFQDHVQVFGIDHIETFGCRHDLALMHFMREEFDEARRILEPLHKETTEKLGHTSRVTHPIANNLAACANMQGDYDYAEKILYTIPGLAEAAAEPLEIDIATTSTHTLHALSILAAVFGARDEDRRSEILHQRVIDGLTVQTGPKSLRVYESAINKGQALRDQFKYNEARNHYFKWLKKSNQDYGTDSQYSRQIRERLLDIDHQEKKWNAMSQELNSSLANKVPAWKRLTNYRWILLVVVTFFIASTWYFFLSSRL